MLSIEKSGLQAAAEDLRESLGEFLPGPEQILHIDICEAVDRKEDLAAFFRDFSFFALAPEPSSRADGVSADIDQFSGLKLFGIIFSDAEKMIVYGRKADFHRVFHSGDIMSAHRQQIFQREGVPDVHDRIDGGEGSVFLDSLCESLDGAGIFVGIDVQQLKSAAVGFDGRELSEIGRGMFLGEVADLLLQTPGNFGFRSGIVHIIDEDDPEAVLRKFVEYLFLDLYSVHAEISFRIRMIEVCLLIFLPVNLDGR